MKIYKNQSVSYPCYFIRTGQPNTKSSKNGESLSTGYIVELYRRDWQCQKVNCYDSLLNSNFVCIVDNKESANCFIKNAIINAVLELIPRAKREKDEGLKAAQRLLLTWISEHPDKLTQLKEIITPKDFSDPLYREIACVMYRHIEHWGYVIPELLITNFNKSEYHEIEKIFNVEPVQDESGSHKTRGIRECVIRLKRHSLQEEADTTDDIKRLQEVMEELKGLDHLNISF